MAAIKTEILDVLQQLLESEFKEFKWHLSNGVAPEPIPRGKLENARHHDVVDYMVQQYGASDAGKIAVRALRSIKQNELANELKGKLQEVSPSVSEEDTAGAAASSTAAGQTPQAPQTPQTLQTPQAPQAPQTPQTPAVAVNVQSSSGASVKAPVVHGSVFNGPVTFN